MLAINVREGDETEAADLESHVAQYFDNPGYGFVNLQGTDALLDAYKAHGIPHIFVVDAVAVRRCNRIVERALSRLACEEVPLG